jgi:hypothetical protein
MSLAKCQEKFARKYLQKCPQSSADLCRHAYLHLNSDLCLDLNNKLFAELNREKLEKSFQQLFLKSFALSFDSLFVQKYQRLWVLSYLVLCRQTLPRGRPLGRPLHGRIVA